MTTRSTQKSPPDPEPLPLPPLDDDGTTAARDDDADENEGLGALEGPLMSDDLVVGTGEDELGVAVEIGDESRSIDDDIEGTGERDDDEDVRVGDEGGWLDESHEPIDRGEDVDADDLVPALPGDRDDGGAEGTDEDPAAALELGVESGPRRDGDDDDDAPTANEPTATLANLDERRWPPTVSPQWPLRVGPPRAIAHESRALDDRERHAVESIADATHATALGGDAGWIVALWDSARAVTAFVHLDAQGRATRVAEHRFSLDDDELSPLDDAAGAVRSMRVGLDDVGAVVFAECDAAELTLRIPARLLAAMP